VCYDAGTKNALTCWPTLSCVTGIEEMPFQPPCQHLPGVIGIQQTAARGCSGCSGCSGEEKRDR